MYYEFDCVVIDFFFVILEVWVKYVEVIFLLFKDGGKIILSMILENVQILKQMLNVEFQIFQFLVLYLVYQYKFFINYNFINFFFVNFEVESC